MSKSGHHERRDLPLYFHGQKFLEVLCEMVAWNHNYGEVKLVMAGCDTSCCTDGICPAFRSTLKYQHVGIALGK